MPAEFETGFFVYKPAWHGLGEVLDEYPGREVAQEKAGHGFNVIERPVYLGSYETQQGGPNDGAILPRPFLLGEDDTVRQPEHIQGFKALVRDDTGKILNVTTESYGVIQNDVGWDIVDALVGEGVKYECGITLKDGALCSVLAWLDEPVQVSGDNSPILPYLNVSWAHDGSAAFRGRSTNVRVVCANTESAAEAQGERLGTDFTFRHSKNVMARIEDAKMAIQGIRDNQAAFMKVAEELAATPVTEDQRELFVQQFIPMPQRALISETVKNNIEKDRAKLRGTFESETIPEEHRLTGYGLSLAGVEFLDHLRGWRNPETKFNRSMLREEPAKKQLSKLIREVAKA